MSKSHLQPMASVVYRTTTPLAAEQRNSAATLKLGCAETQCTFFHVAPYMKLTIRDSEDCAPGTCYEGTCPGANEYAIDGKCGWQNGYLKCGGKWGSCCNTEGQCGSGSDFCGLGKCQSGNCTMPTVIQPPSESPWMDGNSTDGTCGGPKNFICNPVFGYCCGSDGTCGSGKTKCGSGW
jgi:hypothetical protein